MVQTNQLKEGAILSESSHYRMLRRQGDTIVFKHVESNSEVTLNDKYVERLLTSADQFSEVIEVGKEDKFWTEKQVTEYRANHMQDPESQMPKVGDLRVAGIRSIFEGIHTDQAFTVCFRKADKPLSAKRLNELREEQATEIAAIIEETATAKKGVARKAKELIRQLQENPVLPFEPGESRVLRGFKVQFTSRDGKYNCIDLDIPEANDGSNVRPVNINTLQWIIYNDVKYVLEKQ